MGKHGFTTSNHWKFDITTVRHHLLKSWRILRRKSGNLGRQRIELLEANVDKHWTGPLQLAKKCLVDCQNFGMFCNRAMDFQKNEPKFQAVFVFTFPSFPLSRPAPTQWPKAPWRCLEPERWQKTAGPGMPGFNHRWWKNVPLKLCLKPFCKNA